MLATKNAYEVAAHVGKQTQIVQSLFNEKSTEGVQRYENVQELLNSIKEWTESPDNEEGELVDKSLGAYLQQITLLTDTDNKDSNADTVKLMTIHGAKGLEFECVFAGGLEEQIFPNTMAINTREELEEERRLFYVVITRAKKKLWITYANTRYKFGSLVQNEPSRFLRELPEEMLDKSMVGSSHLSPQHSSSAHSRMGGWRNNAEPKATYPEKKNTSTPSYLAPKTTTAKVVEHRPAEDFLSTDPATLVVGNRVEHQRFGFGNIKTLEGAAHNPIAMIHFDLNGEKKIMLNYAKLRRVEG